MEVLRAALGRIAAAVARLWVASLRVRVHGNLGLGEGRARILAFFHGTQLMLHALPRARRTCVMVSLSRDGDIQAAALRALGFEVVRGSSSRGGARALATLVRRLRASATDAVFAVDGPRGPYGVVKSGVLFAATRAHADIVPAGAAARRALVLSRAWDRFVVPWPFTQVDIVLGDPFAEPPDHATLARAIAGCNDAAHRLGA